MFERYTERARRVVFFARYEASNYGSRYIETEHLLLGLLREDRALAARLAKDGIVGPEIRSEIEKRITATVPAMSRPLIIPPYYSNPARSEQYKLAQRQAKSRLVA